MYSPCTACLSLFSLCRFLWFKIPSSGQHSRKLCVSYWWNNSISGIIYISENQAIITYLEYRLNNIFICQLWCLYKRNLFTTHILLTNSSTRTHIYKSCLIHRKHKPHDLVNTKSPWAIMRKYIKRID